MCIRDRLSGVLSSPFTTPEQRAYALAALARLDLWERGMIPEAVSEAPTEKS